MSGTDEDRLSQCKSDIRSVLIAAKDGFTASELIRDYSEFVGGSIPYAELGFRNLHNMLENMPDVVYVEQSNNGTKYHAVPDESTLNLKKLVSRQKTSNKKKKRGTGGHVAAQTSWCMAINHARNQASSRPVHRMNHGPNYNYTPNSQRSSLPQTQRSKSTTNFMMSNNQRPNSRPNPSNWIIQCLSRHPKGISLACLRNEVEQKSRGSFKFASIDEVRMYLQSIPAIVFYDEIMDKAFLRNYTQGSGPVNDLQTYFPKRTGFGFCAPPQAFPNCPMPAQPLIQPFYLNQSNNYPPVIPKQPSFSRQPFLGNVNDPIMFNPIEPPEVDKHLITDRIIRIVKDYRNGVNVKVLETIYQDRYNRSIPVASLNCKSIVDFLSSIKNFKVTTVNDEDFVLCYEDLDCASSIVSEKPALSNNTIILGQTNLLPVFKPAQYCLSGFADAKCKFPPAKTPNYDDPFTGIIVTFYSVEDFFVRRTDSELLLQQMVDSLKSFYGPRGPGDNEEAVIPKEMVTDLAAELPCAVYWLNNWYRAYILGCQNSSAPDVTVSVRLVDIGILDTVSLQQTRRLAVRFVSEPVQVIRARLARVLKTANNDFLIHKCRCYVDRITSNRQIIATAVHDNKNDLRAIGRLPLSIGINKMSGISNDICINDLSSHLVSCGLAVLDESQASMPTNQNIEFKPPNTEQVRSGNLQCNPMFRVSDSGYEPVKIVQNKNLSNGPEITSNSVSNGLVEQLKKCVISYEQRCDVDRQE